MLHRYTDQPHTLDLRRHRPVRRRHARQLSKTILRVLRILCQLLHPHLEILEESLSILRVAEVARLVVLTDLLDQRPRRHYPYTHVVLIERLLDGTLEFAVKDAAAKGVDALTEPKPVV